MAAVAQPALEWVYDSAAATGEIVHCMCCLQSSRIALFGRWQLLQHVRREIRKEGRGWGSEVVKCRVLSEAATRG